MRSIEFARLTSGIDVKRCLIRKIYLVERKSRYFSIIVPWKGGKIRTMNLNKPANVPITTPINVVSSSKFFRTHCFQLFDSCELSGIFDVAIFFFINIIHTEHSLDRDFKQFFFIEYCSIRQVRPQNRKKTDSSCDMKCEQQSD